MRRKKVIDEALEISDIHRANPGELGEDQRACQLSDRHGQVRIVEFSGGRATCQHSIKGFSVLVDYAHPQRPQCVWFFARLLGNHCQPSQCGQLQRSLFGACQMVCVSGVVRP